MTARRFHSFTLLLIVAAIASAAAACAADSGRAAEPTPSPDPSGRVNIRQGLFNHTSPLATASFSAVLPEGWSAVDLPVEGWRSIPNYPSGLIVKQGTDARLHYTVMPAGEASISMISGHIFERVDVGGVTVEVQRPIEVTAEGSDYRIFAEFKELSDQTGDGQPFSLEISGRNLTPAQLDEARTIIESVRREPPLALPQPPEPQVTPGPNWHRVNAFGFHDQSIQPLSVLAPPGWRFVPRQGIDTFGGIFTDGETEIRVLYGPHAGMPVDLDYEASDPVAASQYEMWEEVIDGKQIMFFRPEPGHSGPLAVTGIYTDRIPGLPSITPSSSGVWSSQIFSCGGSFSSNTTDPDQQDLVLAILRTLQAERQSEWCS